MIIVRRATCADGRETSFATTPARLVRQVSEIRRLEQITILDQTPATSCGR